MIILDAIEDPHNLGAIMRTQTERELTESLYETKSGGNNDVVARRCRRRRICPVARVSNIAQTIDS